MSAIAAGCDPGPVASRTPRLLPHLVVAAGVLIALAFWVQPAGQVSVDEGVAVAQARAVARGSWGVDHPLEAIDPSGAAFALRDGVRTGGGYVFFAKHPAYPALLSVADRAAGTAGMVGLSVMGVLAAGAAAAALARRLDPRLAVPALYATALASPLLFDSTLVIAHGVGAAAAGLAALAVVRHHERQQALTGWLALAGVATAATVMLRGEGVLLAGSACVVVGAIAIARRSSRWAIVAGALAGSTGTAFLVDRWWAARILGRGITLPGATADSVSWVRARLDGLATTLLQTSYGGGRAAALLLGGAVALVVAAVALRRGGSSARLAGPAALAASVLVAAWGVLTDPGPVPGLLVAFPTLWFGLCAGRWTDAPLARALVGVAAVFAIAVAATQYRQGGGYEWGFRYVALALPLVVPVALLGLVRALDAAGDRSTRLVVGGALGAIALILSAVGLVTRLDTGRAATRLGDAIIATAPSSHLGPDDRDGRPVVLSTELAVPQATSRILDDARWLRLYDLSAREAGAYVPRLLAAGIDRFSYVTFDPADQATAPSGTAIASRARVGAWTILVLTPRMAGP
jgi:hypothetical protein